MNIRWLVIAAAVVGAAPCLAGWNIQHVKDRMTDRDVALVSLSAKAPDHGVAAMLTLDCVPQVGAVLAGIALDSPLEQTRVGMRFRVDDGKTEMRVVSAMGSTQAFTIFGFDARSLAKARRFRVELSAQPPLFYDFDLAGADAALKALHCPPPGGRR